MGTLCGGICQVGGCVLSRVSACSQSLPALWKVHRKSIMIAKRDLEPSDP
jgi:hypothetical protein